MSRFGAELKRASMLRVAAAASRENCGWSCFESVGCGSICPLSSRGMCACLVGGSKETPTVAQAGIGGKLYSAPPGGDGSASPAWRRDAALARTNPPKPSDSAAAASKRTGGALTGAAAAAAQMAPMGWAEETKRRASPCLSRSASSAVSVARSGASVARSRGASMNGSSAMACHAYFFPLRSSAKSIG